MPSAVDGTKSGVAVAHGSDPVELKLKCRNGREAETLKKFAAKLSELVDDFEFGELRAVVKKTDGGISFAEIGNFEHTRFR